MFQVTIGDPFFRGAVACPAQQARGRHPRDAFSALTAGIAGRLSPMRPQPTAASGSRSPRQCLKLLLQVLEPNLGNPVRRDITVDRRIDTLMQQLKAGLVRDSGRHASLPPPPSEAQPKISRSMG